MDRGIKEEDESVICIDDALQDELKMLRKLLAEANATIRRQNEMWV